MPYVKLESRRPASRDVTRDIVTFMFSADTCDMAATNAKKLENLNAAAANRQQRRRRRMAARGRPDTAVVDRAIVEALAFALAVTPASADSVTAAVVSVSTLTATTLAILVDREGNDRRETAMALKLRLQERPIHRDPSFVPSLYPDPDRQAERLTIAQQARQSAANA